MPRYQRVGGGGGKCKCILGQGFSLASAKFQMSEPLQSSLDSLSETIFGNTRCMVMHSGAIVFLL